MGTFVDVRGDADSPFLKHLIKSGLEPYEKWAEHIGS